MENKKIMILIIAVLVVLIGGVVIYKMTTKKDPGSPDTLTVTQNPNTDFDFKVIYETNNLVQKQNYLISPLSMGFALSLLNEGADGNTKTEIDKLLNGYKLPTIMNVKDRIGIANLLFVKDKYEKDISKDYISILQNKYDSDVMFDEFVTAKKANDWISDKTYKMIPEAIGPLSEDFVLGVANTVAIDVEWRNTFECYRTKKEEFTKADNTKMDTAMMHGDNDVYYLENDNAKGIIKNYKIYDTKTNNIVWEENENTVALEYIAILPNKDITEYLKTFNANELKNLLSTQKGSDAKTDIIYSLPKYTYDYTYEPFQTMLNRLGMNDAFNGNVSNFKKMVNSDSDLKLYVSKSIHKTHIELSEHGTKAAAVTAFILDKATAIMEPKTTIQIEFNKPFIYIIKDKNSDNIWFFGTVYEPLKWEENTNTCDMR